MTEDLSKEFETLKTEIAGLKIRLSRLESYLLTIQDPSEYIKSDTSDDEMLEEAIKLVKTYNNASASFLQRKLGIEYSRAARIIDQLEEKGIVGPANGSEPREILQK